MISVHLVMILLLAARLVLIKKHALYVILIFTESQLWKKEFVFVMKLLMNLKMSVNFVVKVSTFVNHVQMLLIV